MFNILIVDDELDVLDAIMMNFSLFLTKSKFILNEFSDSLKALDEITNNDIYSILISDIDMPNLDGIDLIKQVREKNKKIEIFIFSGNITPEIKDDLKDLRINEFVEKPNLELLVEKINNLELQLS